MNSVDDCCLASTHPPNCVYGAQYAQSTLYAEKFTEEVQQRWFTEEVHRRRFRRSHGILLHNRRFLRGRMLNWFSCRFLVTGTKWKRRFWRTASWNCCTVCVPTGLPASLLLTGLRKVKILLIFRMETAKCGRQTDEAVRSNWQREPNEF